MKLKNKKNLLLKGLVTIPFISLATTIPYMLCSCKTNDKENGISKIEVSKQPSVVEFHEGEKFDLNGLEVNISYKNGKVENIDSSSEKFKTDFETFPKNGETLFENLSRTVRVQHKSRNLSTTFKISVGDAIIKDFVIVENPSTMNYSVDDKLNLDGLKVGFLYTDGVIHNVDLNECDIQPSNGTVFDAHGQLSFDEEVKILHKETGRNTSFNVHIGPSDITKIEATVKGTNFLIGRPLNLDKLVVMAKNDEGKQSVDVTKNCTISPAPGTILSESDNKISIQYKASTGQTFDTAINFEPKYPSFFKDSWEEVVKTLNDGGISALCKTYNFKDKKDLIGLEKQVIINNQPHIVRVIGVEHDELAEETNKKASLTFELKTLLSDSNGNKITTPWDKYTRKSPGLDYTNSVLRKNLTGKGFGCQTTKQTVFSMLPGVLQANIKTVKKEVTITEKWLTEKHITYNDKLFPLTLTEISGQNVSLTYSDGSIYEFWEKRKESEYRKKHDVNKSNNSPYWLCSPELRHNEFSFAIQSRGNAYCDIIQSTTEDHGISFCFCI